MYGMRPLKSCVFARFLSKGNFTFVKIWIFTGISSSCYDYTALESIVLQNHWWNSYMDNCPKV